MLVLIFLDETIFSSIKKNAGNEKNKNNKATDLKISS